MKRIASLRFPSLATVWVPSLAACTVLVVLFSLACDTDQQRIREANEAAQESERTLEVASTPTPTALTTTISIFDIRDGDCLNFFGAPDFQVTVRLEEVKLVECSGPWEAKVLHSFVVDLEGPFPGEDYFMSQWAERCDRRSTLAKFPLSESWTLGDRTVQCLQASFDQTEASANFVRSMALAAGDCYNDVPLSNGTSVEVVPCANENWTWRVLNVFDVAAGGPYPGDSYFELQADARCQARYEFYLYPLPETWAYGDRSIQCLQGK